MLDGYIEVVDDFFGVGDGFDEPVVDTGGVKVEQTEPFEVCDTFEFVEKCGEAVFDFEVSAIVCGVLGDDVKLDCTGGDKLFGL